jgi:uncharacterized protein
VTSLLAVFADISLAQIAIVVCVAFLTSVVSGLTGFGVGLALPAFLAPIVGIAGLVPTMAVVMLISNLSRVLAFWRALEWRIAPLVLVTVLPITAIGAVIYTRLPERAIAVILGLFMLAMLPTRRLLARWQVRPGRAAFLTLGVAYGALAGATTGSGVLLASGLVALGLAGPAVVATDAAVATLVNVVRLAVFGAGDALDAFRVSVGVFAGLCTIPGTLVARRLMHRISLAAHVWIMETITLGAGLWFLWRGLV